MSKRSGEFVTLREVVDEVGRDAVRFDMLYRKNDAVLDFDLAKVIEHTRENPVFYVQYGHARGESMFRNAREEMPELPLEAAARAHWLEQAPLDRLSDSGELAILRRMALYPRLVEAAAAAHEPHRVAFYLYELASEFHAHWTRGKDLPHLRFIIQNDPETTVARLALVQGIVTVLASGLSAARGRSAGRNAVIFRSPARLWAGRDDRRGRAHNIGDRMADDHNQRPYRSNEPPARGAPAGRPACRHPPGGAGIFRRRSARRACPPDRTKRSVRRIRPRWRSPARGPAGAAPTAAMRAGRCARSGRARLTNIPRRQPASRCRKRNRSAAELGRQPFGSTALPPVRSLSRRERCARSCWRLCRIRRTPRAPMQPGPWL